jgi:hypothetical protein
VVEVNDRTVLLSAKQLTTLLDSKMLFAAV